MVRQLPADSMAAGPRPAMMLLTVDDYIQRAGPMLMRDGFFENEIHSEIERYGNVAHVWSTYESRLGSPDIAPFEGAGAGAIPAEYLP